MVKTVTTPPMPSVSETTAVAVNAGRRASTRHPTRMSVARSCSHRQPQNSWQRSRVRSGLPNRRRAAVRRLVASRPSLSRSRALISRWNVISSSISRSRRRRERNRHNRRQKAAITHPLSGRPQDAGDGLHHLRKRCLLAPELRPAGGRQAVVARAPVER